MLYLSFNNKFSLRSAGYLPTASEYLGDIATFQPRHLHLPSGWCGESGISSISIIIYGYTTNTGFPFLSLLMIHIVVLGLLYSARIRKMLYYHG
jgi:hypothetical protein